MKISLIVLIAIFSACAIPGQRTDNPENVKSETNRVIKELESKPKWLFDTEECPAAAMRDEGKKPQDMNDSCRADPMACLEKCKSENGDFCYALGHLIQKQTKIGNEASEALFLRSCKLGITSGCTNRAATKLESEPNDPSVQKCIADIFEKTCAQNDPWGCAMLGLTLAEGIGRDKDINQALAVLRKACDISIEKNGEACVKANALREAVLRLQKPEGEIEK